MVLDIRQIRENHGLSILDVSVETDYSESHLAQIERDKRRPSFDCIMDLMGYYECEPNEVFGYPSEDDFAEGDSNSYETRLNNLSFKDKHRAKKTIDVLLEAFEEVG